jgi:antibiotic biosynthesis monooxygenase (ABM) superfamily enzyme
MSNEPTGHAGVVVGETNHATAIITRLLEPGREQDYTAWVSRLVAAVEAAPHTLGTVVLAPRAGESNTFTG